MCYLQAADVVLLAPVHDEDEQQASAGFDGGFEGPFGPP